MNTGKKSNMSLIIIIAIAVLVAATGGMVLTRNMNKSSKVVDTEKATKTLAKYLKDIDPIQGSPVKGTITFDDTDTTFQELPELTDDSIAVRPNGFDYAEIFASSEKTGSDKDGWLREMAERFNAQYNTASDGATMAIMVRTVSSGQQIDYVASGKYVPAAISPSSKLQVEMLNAKGVKTSYAADSLVMNYAGVVVNSTTYSTLVEDYGNATAQNIAKAVADGKITMGYTNPFTSATGFNFLVTVLDSYDKGNISSSTAVSGFEAFQRNIPFVAMTTGQMRSSAEKGTFDAFVSEYQTYINDNTLAKNYKFIPFGYQHDNPLALIESASPYEKETIKAFVEFCKTEGKSLAEADGFNKDLSDYHSMATTYTGKELINAQELYKEHKDSKPVVCVFVADVSGSMDGEPINSLKESLVNSMQYINNTNYIGLVSYSDRVKIELPIAQFDMNQQSYFKGTVETLQANGGTATYDGVCVALDMIQKQMEITPDVKPIVFVLSDGDQNRGLSLNKVSDVIYNLQIPIYTICYNNGGGNDMKALSAINEGAAINASTDDVTYQLKQLFNANM